jgi:hypothetical protein
VGDPNAATKMTLPEGAAPRLAGPQKPLSAALSNLRDFLWTSREARKNVRGDVFTVEEYGGGIGENLRWVEANAPKPSSRMTVNPARTFVVFGRIFATSFRHPSCRHSR